MNTAAGKSIFSIHIIVAALGLLLSPASVSADQWVYAAWPIGPEPVLPAPPFYWIGQPWPPSIGVSTAPGAPPQAGCYYHNCNNLIVGDGYGINLVGDTLVGDGTTVRYQVEVSFPSANCSTDVVMSLSSTNAFIGGVIHGTASACTAFRSAFAASPAWSTVCYLTNYVGTRHPNIEFRYVSGVNNRIYADLVRFNGGICCCLPPGNLALQTPVCTNVSYVTVTGETNTTDQALLVYQRVNLTETLIGTLTSGIVVGTNLVPVTWRADSLGAQVIVSRLAASGGETCHTYPGLVVGGACGARITGLTVNTLQYAGGCGARFILLRSADPCAARCNWQRADTNSACAGCFTIPTVAAGSSVFYCIQSE